MNYNKKTKKELIEIIEKTNSAISMMIESQSSPPIVMMDPKEVVKKLNDTSKTLGKFKKLFWRFYFKCN